MTVRQGNAYTQPSFSLEHRLARMAWNAVYVLLFRPSPRVLHGWRAWLLRRFGATVGESCHVYPGARIWAPWNLHLGRYVGVADDAILYCMDRMEIGDYAVISQGAHLCGGTHDYNSADFQLVVRPIVLSAHVWICAEAFVHSGVSVAEGVVLGARSVATKNLLEPWAVYGGHPCRKLGERIRSAKPTL